MRVNLNVNGVERPVEVDEDTPLLWVIREELGLTGTKFGCGIAQCGACTVHMNGEATRSCVLPASAVEGQKIMTIEALATTPQAKLQQAWIDEQVSQCGYCQSGMLMAAAALLRAKPKPTEKDIDEAMTNICRCGTYPRVKRAIQRAAGVLSAA
jgi:isoquinoline 1-oxidoreductase alpha subunit